MPIALLMKPSGATVARLERDHLPDTIEHDGQAWIRSHATVTGAAYQGVSCPNRSTIRQ